MNVWQLHYILIIMDFTYVEKDSFSIVLVLLHILVRASILLCMMRVFYPQVREGSHS